MTGWKFILVFLVLIGQALTANAFAATKKPNADAPKKTYAKTCMADCQSRGWVRGKQLPACIERCEGNRKAGYYLK